MFGLRFGMIYRIYNKLLFIYNYYYSGGSSSGLVKLYLSEIVALASTLLAESPSWPIKKQIGATFSDLATISERSFFTHLPVVTPLILESLGFFKTMI